jgi:hypothetical protein
VVSACPCKRGFLEHSRSAAWAVTCLTQHARTIGVREGWRWLRPVVGLDVLEARQVCGAQPHQPRRCVHRLLHARSLVL